MSQKTFSTFDEQIALLRSEKHLIIEDEKYAKDMQKICLCKLVIFLYSADINISFVSL